MITFEIPAHLFKIQTNGLEFQMQNLLNECVKMLNEILF